MDIHAHLNSQKKNKCKIEQKDEISPLKMKYHTPKTLKNNKTVQILKQKPKKQMKTMGMKISDNIFFFHPPQK